MADGDKVHPGLQKRYQKPYKQLCEGQFSDASIALGVVDRVKVQLKEAGDAPARLIGQIANRIESAAKEPLLTNWQRVGQEVERMASRVSAPKRLREQIVEASKQLLHEARIGGSVSEPHRQLMERTMDRLYTAEFEQRVPMAQHYNNVSQEYVDGRLKGMRPHVEKELAHIAEQAVKRGSFQRLRRSRLGKPKTKLLDIDISSLN
jgi:hypothetical protein